MVMDATQPQQPSPQSVGREFVRQYYTLLNKAPNHLHRFYNNNSSFIHGESTLVVGQKNIHNRIQQLNFHDCHAKISQVDAQATLGNGVVVQVTGELSNDGQPMRRFTQTFVLAAQSPKKYYVHNDIFRYQDLYSDEETDAESRSENDDEHEQQPQQVPPQPQGGQGVVAAAVQQVNDQQIPPAVGGANEQQPLPSQVVTAGAAATGVLAQQAQTVYYPMPVSGGRPMAVLPPPPGATPVALAANFANAAANVPPQAGTTAAGVTQLNGVVAHDEIMSNMQQSTVSQQPPQLTNQTPSPVLSQAAGAVSVGNPAIIGAQTPSSGVTGFSVVSSASAPTGLQQNAAPPAIPNYQQSPLMQTHILQQQPQMQQQLPNLPSQQLQQQPTIMQQQQSHTPLASAASNMGDGDDSIIPNTMSMSATNAPTSQLTELQQQSRPNTAANVVASGQTIAPISANTVLEPTSAPVVEDFKTINEQQQQEKYEAAKQQQHQQNEPKTYANLFKSSSPSSFVNAAMQQQQQIQQQQQQSANSMLHQTNSSNISSSNTYSQSAGSPTTSSIPVYGNRNNDSSSSMRQQQDNNNSQGSGVPLPQRSNAKGFNKDFDQRRTSNVQQFGDNQQLFLGNIPHHASEEELKVLFSRFGQVVDLRILSKSSGKIPPGGRNPLNYGFITYNDPEAVQNCLANCPLYFPDGPEGQKLNVEEKKPRARNNEMAPRQSLGGSGINSNMNNNQRNMSGGPPSRSLSNSGSGGSMMRGNSVGNNSNSMSRGGSSGGGGSGGVPSRMGGAFNRNDNRASNGSGGSQMRGGNNNSQSQASSYGVRR